MFKYWPEAEYKKFIRDAESLEKKYDKKIEVHVVNNHIINAEKAYRKLKHSKDSIKTNEPKRKRLRK